MPSVTGGTGRCDGCHASNSSRQTTKSHVRNVICKSVQRPRGLIIGIEIEGCASTPQARKRELPYLSIKMGGERCNSQDRVRAVSQMCDCSHTSLRSSSTQTTYRTRRCDGDAKTPMFSHVLAHFY